MPFPPKRDHKITLQAAEALMRRYREQAGPGAQKGCMFPRDVFEALLAQAGCAGIRMYYAQNEGGGRDMVLVGVDATGNDQTSLALYDASIPCPPYCGGD